MSGKEGKMLGALKILLVEGKTNSVANKQDTSNCGMSKTIVAKGSREVGNKSAELD